jgi:hypothetical protein
MPVPMQHNARALPGTCLRHRSPDATAGAGDQHAFSLQIFDAQHAINTLSYHLYDNMPFTGPAAVY